MGSGQCLWGQAEREPTRTSGIPWTAPRLITKRQTSPMHQTVIDISCFLPRLGEIQTLPAISSSLVPSCAFRYSRSDLSSSTFAQGNAILNMPVALTNPSLLRRCQCALASRFRDGTTDTEAHSPSKSRSPDAAGEYAKGKSQSLSDPSAEARGDERIRRTPGSLGESHSRCRSAWP